jgi:hypothetical protein
MQLNNKMGGGGGGKVFALPRWFSEKCLDLCLSVRYPNSGELDDFPTADLMVSLSLSRHMTDSVFRQTTTLPSNFTTYLAAIHDHLITSI